MADILELTHLLDELCRTTSDVDALQCLRELYTYTLAGSSLEPVLRNATIGDGTSVPGVPPPIVAKLLNALDVYVDVDVMPVPTSRQTLRAFYTSSQLHTLVPLMLALDPDSNILARVARRLSQFLVNPEHRSEGITKSKAIRAAADDATRLQLFSAFIAANGTRKVQQFSVYGTIRSSSPGKSNRKDRTNQGKFNPSSFIDTSISSNLFSLYSEEVSNDEPVSVNLSLIHI